MTEPAITQSASEPAAEANSGKVPSIAIWQTLLIALIVGQGFQALMARRS